ncbi:MAG: RHS repeat-associated protein, partial [Chlamydiales bacterium]
WKNISELLFLYQKDREIAATDVTGKIVELRVLGRSEATDIGTSVAMELDAKTYVPVHNHRGSITALVDADTNSVIESYRHSTFGEEQIFNADGDAVEGSQAGNPWRYSSKRVDEETGLIFFGLRYYMPETGRWITRDPAGFADGPNLYAYVHGNPMRYYDPYGLWSIEGAMESVSDFFSGFCSGSNDDGSMSGGDIAMSGACVVAAPFLFEGGAVAATAFAVFEIGVAAAYTGKALYDCVSGDRFSKGGAGTSGSNIKVSESNIDVSEPSVDRFSSSNSNTDSKVDKKATTPNQLGKQVERGQAPKEVDRVDKGNGDNDEKDHIHFTDGSALNRDGTWKHGFSELSKKSQQWLVENGWSLPK